MGRSRAWVAAAIGLLAAALIGMHALSAPPAMAMSAGHHSSVVMAPSGPSLTAPMSACGQHPCVSHRLASTPVPQSTPVPTGRAAAAVVPPRPSRHAGTSHCARPPPRAGGGAVLGVWRQ
ncbi:hypothetical protein GCM10028801_42110 [Nocardioides maradonensis]